MYCIFSVSRTKKMMKKRKERKKFICLLSHYMTMEAVVISGFDESSLRAGVSSMEYLSRKFNGLSSNPSTAQKERKKGRKERRKE
jgi:hypothetical protein